MLKNSNVQSVPVEAVGRPLFAFHGNRSPNGGDVSISLLGAFTDPVSLFPLGDFTDPVSLSSLGTFTVPPFRRSSDKQVRGKLPRGFESGLLLQREQNPFLIRF